MVRKWKKFYTSIFTVKENIAYINLDISEKGLEKYRTSEDYLNLLENILSLQNPVRRSDGKTISLLEIINRDEYIITNDNSKKMILILCME